MRAGFVGSLVLGLASAGFVSAQSLPTVPAVNIPPLRPVVTLGAPVSLGRPVPLDSTSGVVRTSATGTVVRGAMGDPLNGPGAPPPPGAPIGPPPVGPPPVGPPPMGPPTGAPTCPGPPAAQNDGRVWLSAEYLLWWVKNGPPLPPLVPFGASPVLDPAALRDLSIRGGAGQSFNYGTFSGLRVGAGTWIGCDKVFGVESNFLLLERRSDSRRGAAAEDSLPLIGAVPSTATIVLNSNTQLFGFEVNGLYSLTHDCSSHLELIGGVRNLDLNENLALNAGARTPFLPVPSIAGYADSFRTQNFFWGPQLGVRGGFHFGKLSADATLKVALGDTHEIVNVNGVSGGNIGGVPILANQGLYAQPTNIGRQTHDNFAVVPEVGFTVGYNFTQNFRAFVGYNFLYISSVARPGNQVDPYLNISQFTGPLVGPARPTRIFKDGDFWAQGLTFGVEYTF